jgi:hypothetical protein
LSLLFALAMTLPNLLLRVAVAGAGPFRSWLMLAITNNRDEDYEENC